FFSSRRRHTRFSRDWSSDVCSSDLSGKIASGELQVPAGVRYEFSGNYENQLRAEKRLSIVVPLSLIAIFLILYFQFRSVATTLRSEERRVGKVCRARWWT